MTALKQTDMDDTNTHDEIDLRELFAVLWGAKTLIISMVSVFGLCSIFIVLMMTPYYKSETILTLAGDSVQNTGFALGGSNATLARVAGINLPSSGVTDKGELVVATVNSRSFLKHLMTFEDVLPSLMAAKDFDVSKQILIFDNNDYDVQTKTWVRQDKPQHQASPSVLETYKEYRDRLFIHYDDRSGFVTISVEHISPIFAKEFLDLIISEVNELMRQKDLEESTNALEFLKSEMVNTSFVEIKYSINQLIQSQLETQMRAKVREDYVLRKIEPPFTPEEQSSPNSILICIFGTMLGGILSVLWVLYSQYGNTFIGSKGQYIVNE